MFKIKNWKEHQPNLRKDRNVIWIKVYRRLLEDFDYQNLTDTNKATLIELWLIASEDQGSLPEINEICFRLRRDKPFIIKQLQQLSSFVLQDVDKKLPKVKQNVSLDIDVDIDIKKNRVEVDNGFELFWNNYPKKVGKGKAEIAWIKHSPNIDLVLKTLTWQKESKEWFKENGAFIPHPTTYINGKRWLDEKTEGGTF
tara:strand:+ start:833 stop:1426 length:594 start_codon:yes stop_codon:yes gene_type:complete